MSRYSVVAIVVGLAVSTSTPIAGVAAQQSPFKPPSNLRVLPKDTKLAEIIPMMKSFTQALGVRCQFCHSYAGSDPNALENFDFPDDAVPAKTAARTMMAAVQAINGDLLKGVGEPAPAGQSKVTCYTCHRGERKPQTAPGPPR
jgi:photosynthetic reaction center cytochrome c subunit